MGRSVKEDDQAVDQKGAGVLPGGSTGEGADSVDIDAFLARRQAAQVNLAAMVENVLESLCPISSHLAGEGR
jgi:hypothetical protein